MFENTKLKPIYNGYQYLFIFIVAIALDIIVRFFSLRKYNAMHTGQNVFGFLPGLASYYKTLYRLGPLSINGGPDSMYSKINSWLMGALIAGITAVFMLLVTDIILQLAEYKQKNN